MKLRYIAGLALIVSIALITFWLTDSPIETAPNTKTITTKTTNQSDTTKPQTIPKVGYPESPEPEDSRVTRRANGTVLYNPAIESSRILATTRNPQLAVDTVTELFSHYRFAYKENPVGVENFEFTEQLLGKNPKQIIFIDPQSSALKNNELVDAWNSPYFFHPLSSQELEVRSAGPDRQLWTNDDIYSANTTQP